MDKLESIAAFVQVVEEGSFAGAARRMNVGRSAVNKMVVALENQLKAQLLHRSTRKVTPTPTGVAFYGKCVQILADIEEAELSVSQLHGEPKGLVRINAPMSFGRMYLAPAIAEFMAHYPQLQVDLTLEDRFVDPIAEGYDLVIRIAKPKEIPSLIRHHLFDTQLLLCVAPDYLQRQEPIRQPTDLQHHNCLLYGDRRPGQQWRMVGRAGETTVKVTGTLASNNGEVLAEAAVQGLGIVLMPRFIVEPYLQAGTLQVLLADYCQETLAVSVLYPVNRHLSTKIKMLTEFLQQTFAPLSLSPT